jgi:hypothetical protein
MVRVFRDVFTNKTLSDLAKGVVNPPEIGILWMQAKEHRQERSAPIVSAEPLVLRLRGVRKYKVPK